MEGHFAHSKLIWSPSRPSYSSLDVFRRIVNRKHGLNLEDYHELHKYSIESYNFWMDVWEFVGIISSIPPEKILEEGRMKELPTWFPGARLNYAENLLRRSDDGVACIAARESGAVRHYTFRQLREMVRSLTAAMRTNGITKGDRVAAIVTNSVEAVVIALASAAIGAIFSSTAPDMGTQGILDRYQQIQPKIIFSESQVVYAGKVFDVVPKVSAVAKALVSHGLQSVVLLPSTSTGKELSAARMIDVPKSVAISAFLATGDNGPLVFEQLPFNHPLYILYSSGTTGPPKCIIHSAGGVLLQAKKDLRLSIGLNENDTYFQYTTTGWMMWPYMLHGLACGSCIVVYDGSPFHPDVRNFLHFLSHEGVSVFGTSPRFLSEVQGLGIEPAKLASFAALRVISSTGSVLTPPMFEWTQQAFNPDIHLLSVSGGTDICGAFVGGMPVLPVYAGEIQGKLLGMKVEIFDADGKNIDDTGIPGELVCTRPHPSQPLGFWGDESGEKVGKAYFSTYPGVWHQGDFIVKNPKTQGLMILGRSDGVLNPSGVRFGSAEIYSILEDFSDIIDDSLCVGQRRPKDSDERVLLFLKMRPDHPFNEELVSRIRSAIRAALSPRHVPAHIFEIEEIPYTVNGKKIEIAVKQIVSGSTLKPSGTVANPESLKLYYKFLDLEGLISNKVVKAKL
ncbi:acetoacetate-CoA ligase [Daedalea quercina L-15889]|uniref:Acetoacetate-CoA ligase n=1 Tax=Daedalea quercina L-15889 TaxID=1314783 RepID=A0A165SD11_9APHY|nr:acetoacetate-CoA ligase [Daedalea quercina L-15889]